MIIRICQQCKTEYQPRTVSKQKKFCSLACRRNFETIPERDCLACSKTFKPFERQYRFCSQSCSARYNNQRRAPRSEESKAKTRASIQARITQGLYIPPKGTGRRKGSKNKNSRPLPLCPICNILSLKTRYRKTCNTSTCIATHRKNTTGGYRERSGRGKSGYYRNIFCNSQWELAYLIWMFDHGKTVTRNTVGYPYLDPQTGKPRKFYPDFITDDGFVEIKGWGRRSGINDAKMASVQTPIRFLYESDLERVFSYIAQRYGKSRYNVYELYEERKRGPIMTCRFCSKQFEKKKQRKGLYCSRSCGGNARSQRDSNPCEKIENLLS